MRLKTITLNSAEPFCFYFILLLNGGVIFLNTFFPTLDGPAHLYNSTILSDLLFSEKSIYSDFFELNRQFPPNSLSHVLLVILKTVFPSYFAEKTLILLHLVFTPLLFRSILKSQKKSLWLNLLVFPFTHFSLLYMGFYNFTLGIMLGFLVMNVYFKILEHLSLKKTFVFFLAITALYLSHIFAFMIVLMFLFIHLMITSLNNYKSRINLISLKKTWLYLFAAALPSLVLCIVYLIKRDNHYNFSFLDRSTIVWFYTNCGILQAYGSDENIYCKLVTLILFLLGAILIVQKIKNYSDKKNLSSIIVKHDIFLSMSVLMLILSFFMPNEDGYGGYITIRIVLFAFLFFILWLACNLVPGKVAAILISALLVCHFLLLSKKMKVISELNGVAKEFKKAETFIEKDHSVITIVNYTDLWQIKHFGNYLAADKPVMVFDNYEADAGYFPIVWKTELPCVRLDSTTHPEIICWMSGPAWTKKIIADYILSYNANTMECFSHIKPVLASNYRLLYAGSAISLYGRKK